MLKKIKEILIPNYAKEILNSQKNLIFVVQHNELKDANKAFLNFFDTASLKEFKEKYHCVCDLFVQEEGYLFGDDWINKLLSSLDHHQYKVKIKKNNKEYIFKAEATKINELSIITFTDITILLAQQEKLKEINGILNQYKKAADSLLIVSKTNPKGIITYVNDKFCETSGYSAEELLGKPHNIIRHPDVPKEVFKDLWQTIKSGKRWGGIVKNRKKDGGEYWVDAGIMPIKNHKGEIIEYIALRTDITDIMLAKEKAQQVERVKSLFLANMSHEIRTPLNAILGFTQLLENESELPEKVKGYVKIINSSANTLLRIINDVLDLSKLDAGDFVIEKQEFNPNEVFLEIISLFEARIALKNINYKIELDKISECIISDEHRLKQVLANLIGNAIKFTPQYGEIKVSIKVLEETEDKVKLRFSVKDTGIGIPKDKQNEIFKAFTQADGSITREYGGTGLGLTISSRIVRKLGNGFIEVESEEGKGSEFYFVIEFEKCKNNTSNMAIDSKEQNELTYNKTAKILIAEDDKFNQELIREIFKQWDIDIDIASNGLEAIDKAKSKQYDLIFLDINMPEMSGLDAVKQIKEFVKTPVIALTANAFKEDIKNYLDSGFDDCISKPINLQELKNALDKYLYTQQNKEETEDYLDTLQKAFKLNKDVVKRLVNVYFTTVKDDLESLQKAIKENNFKDIYSFSHKINGASANLKMKDIAKIAEQMEKNASEKIDINYKEKFETLKNLIEDLKKKIEK